MADVPQFDFNSLVTADSGLVAVVSQLNGPTLGIIAIALALAISYFVFVFNTRHARNVRRSKRALKRLFKIDNHEKKFQYLRGLNHFVFEELVLTALAFHGHTIVRNKRYTGDGGIDGRVRFNGRTIFIQAKRYSDYISREHVKEFSNLCKRHNVSGLFVHTGKTGRASWLEARKADISIVSGSDLLTLFNAQSKFKLKVFL